MLTRPLGASFADGMGKPRLAGGLGWGSGTISLSLSAIIVVVVGVVAHRERSDQSGCSAPYTGCHACHLR